MIFNIDNIDNIYLASEYVDFRKSIDGLVAIVNDSLFLNPTSNSLFLFTNKRRNSIKVLYYETNGFWIFQKKLLNRDKFIWVKNDSRDTINITKEQLRWLLQGMEIEPKKHFKNINSVYIESWKNTREI